MSKTLLTEKKYLFAIFIGFLLIQSSLGSIVFAGKCSPSELAIKKIRLKNNTKYEEIIEQGLEHLGENNFSQTIRWLCSQPEIEFATYVYNTMTIKFVDGSYILIIEPHQTIDGLHYYNISSMYYTGGNSRSWSREALILNPFEYVYGNWYCRVIAKDLQLLGYNVTYRANNRVDLNFIRYNLSAEVLYLNTHAGCWDIDGDGSPDEVVIGIGEVWDDETDEKYSFEYENKMIVKARIGDRYVIAFTPYLIDYYYRENRFPGSLIYIAACYVAYDSSMANSFLQAGAKAYMGWSRETVFWTNSVTSIVAFKLLCRGFTVKTVCSLIGYGGLFHVLFKSKLMYYGDGNLKIS